MKTVYLVRHGETEGNVGKIFQGSDTPLNERGLEQARIVAERCAKLPIQAIISSPMARARQTAEVISNKISMPFEANPLFAEARRPTALMGRSTDEPEAREMEKSWVRGYLGEGTKVEDGEHFDEIVQRAGEALDYLEHHLAEHLLVVTHGLFVRALYTRVVFGEAMTSAEFRRVVLSLRTDNTGISVFVRDKTPENPTVRWMMRIWNDHAHLG
ncbi:MAG: hypothetical protein RLZZ416_482 [Candidatus Parcubacteria bacterium]|jgi:broad specificity phosphatase PhoE